MLPQRKFPRIDLTGLPVSTRVEPLGVSRPAVAADTQVPGDFAPFTMGLPHIHFLILQRLGCSSTPGTPHSVEHEESSQQSKRNKEEEGNEHGICQFFMTFASQIEKQPHGYRSKDTKCNDKPGNSSANFRIGLNGVRHGYSIRIFKRDRQTVFLSPYP
jgi:hypothetical protein